MKAVRFHADRWTRGPPATSRSSSPRPGAGRGAAPRRGIRLQRRRRRACGRGFLPIPVALPHVPGYDVSGTVDALGDGVEGLAVGDAVIAFLPMERDGGAAEYVVAPGRRRSSPRPTSIPLADAAALPSVALTAWQALVRRRRPAGRASGCSSSAPAASSASTPSSSRSAPACTSSRRPARAAPTPSRAAGADQVVDHTETDVLGRPRRAGRRAAQPRTDRRRSSSPPSSPPCATAAPSSARPRSWPRRATSRAACAPRRCSCCRTASASTELVALVDAGELTVEVTRRIPLAELPALHAEAAAGRIAGKVVVVP